MKRNAVFLLLVMPLLAMAGERSAADAAVLAAQFMNEQYAQAPQRKAMCHVSSFILSHTRAKKSGDGTAFYVFNKADEGFVVVSGDDRTEDVLMYSDEGRLDVENANPNVQFWLNRLQDEISAAEDANTYSPQEKQARKATHVTAIAPLLKNKEGNAINWYQESPYYNQCPSFGIKKCLTGCVATATAMVMYMWRYPVKGTGSRSYKTTTRKLSVSQDFSAVTFDWDNMLPTYKGKLATAVQQDAVAWLMRCCGVACYMDYTSTGSGALTDQMAYGLTKYFDYKVDRFITTYRMASYGTAAYNPAEYNVSMDQFAVYFNSDLEKGRPIIMGGEDSKEGGHEFVCDGRDVSGNFHFNWGWEGDSNCYCALSALKPTGTGYNFSSGLDAIIGLCPAHPTDVDEVQEDEMSGTCSKCLINNQLVVRYGACYYNAQGQLMR